MIFIQETILQRYFSKGPGANTCETSVTSHWFTKLISNIIRISNPRQTLDCLRGDFNGKGHPSWHPALVLCQIRSRYGISVLTDWKKPCQDQTTLLWTNSRLTYIEWHYPLQRKTSSCSCACRSCRLNYQISGFYKVDSQKKWVRWKR